MMKATTVVDHSSPASVKTQKSLPISRSHGSGYDRTERARTSHACEPCRERKTKCDGERPSCRRCLHTGTSCHYGYGKGWRKRKSVTSRPAPGRQLSFALETDHIYRTAEDLSATSKKLQRYEILLTEISPLVPPEVRAMIEDVRQQEASNNNTPESNDPNTSCMSSSSLTPSMNGERERSGSGAGPRLSLPLPMPGALVSTQPRSQAPLPFDRVTESMSPHLAHHPKREAAYEDASNNRLPSITPSGVLIENGARDSSPTFSRPQTSASLVSASDHYSTSAGSSSQSIYPEKHADYWTRPGSTSAFKLNDHNHQPQSQTPLRTPLTA